MHVKSNRTHENSAIADLSLEIVLKNFQNPKTILLSEQYRIYFWLIQQQQKKKEPS
jgi:hypothetical protein